MPKKRCVADETATRQEGTGETKRTVSLMILSNVSIRNCQNLQRILTKNWFRSLGVDLSSLPAAS